MSALTDIFSSIANAIRGRNGSQSTYKPEEMANAINAIEPMPDGKGVYVSKDSGTTNLYRFFYSNALRADEYLVGTNNTIYIGKGVTDMSQFSYYLNNVGGTNYLGHIHNVVMKSERVINMTQAFTNLFNLNCKVNIPETVTLLSNAFSNCFNYNQPIIYIPANVTNIAYMFRGCRNLQSDIYFNNSSKFTSYGNVRYFLQATGSNRINIHCDNASPFIQTSTYIRGTSGGTWSTMDNGYYNAAVNCYIYNNYVGAR